MDTHRALIAMGGVRARLLDHGQRVRFALKMGLWGPKWPRASAARADGKNVNMHLCSFGRFLPVLSPTFAFATSTALVPWICQGVPFLRVRRGASRGGRLHVSTAHAHNPARTHSTQADALKPTRDTDCLPGGAWRGYLGLLTARGARRGNFWPKPPKVLKRRPQAPKAQNC